MAFLWRWKSGWKWTEKEGFFRQHEQIAHSGGLFVIYGPNIPCGDQVSQQAASRALLPREECLP